MVRLSFLKSPKKLYKAAAALTVIVTRKSADVQNVQVHPVHLKISMARRFPSVFTVVTIYIYLNYSMLHLKMIYNCCFTRALNSNYIKYYATEYMSIIAV